MKIETLLSLYMHLLEEQLGALRQGDPEVAEALDKTLYELFLIMVERCATEGIAKVLRESKADPQTVELFFASFSLNKGS